MQWKTPLIYKALSTISTAAGLCVLLYEKFLWTGYRVYFVGQVCPEVSMISWWLILVLQHILVARITRSRSCKWRSFPWPPTMAPTILTPRDWKLHHRRPQTVAQISHEILETSPEHGHTRPAGKQDGTKDRRQAGLGDEPRRRTQHPRPDGRQAGRQDQRQEKDKPRGADTASQMKDKLRDKTKTKAGETRRETRERQDQGGGQSIPDQMGDKLGDKTGDGPARRTQHPSQDGRQDRGQDRRQRKTRPARRTQHPRPDGRQGGRQDRRQAQRSGHSIPVKADTLRKHWFGGKISWGP